jgi:hypothetical protein
MLGEAAQGFLAEDQLTVDLDLEDAAAGGDQTGFGAKAIFQIGSQTGRLGFVVSNLAVLDGDFHVSILPGA